MCKLYVVLIVSDGSWIVDRKCCTMTNLNQQKMKFTTLQYNRGDDMKNMYLHIDQTIKVHK